MNIVRCVRPLRYAIEGFFYRFTDNPKVLLELQGKYENKPLLVVGNGPSLNHTPLDDFRSVPSIGMNKINLLFPRVAWRPSMIICLNRHVMNQNQNFFGKTEIPVFQCWQCRWFLSKTNRAKSTYFINNSSIDFSRDISIGVGIAGTVTYTCLQFAYYMGANPVILFGVDHSFATKGEANKLVVSRDDDPNHFDRDYFGKGTKWNLPDLDESERGYQLALEAFRADGREVYDATINGKLAIFPKIGVERALEMCR